MSGDTCRDTIQLETAEFTTEYGISKDVHPELPGLEDRIVDFPKVKTGLRPRVAHEVLLLTAIASRVIDIEDPDAATESSGTPSAVEKSQLDFNNENSALQMTEGKGLEDHAQETVVPEILTPGNMHAVGAALEVREEEVAVLKPRVSKKHGRRGNDGADANAPPKVLRKDYASVCPKESTYGGKSLPMIGLAAGVTFITYADTKRVNDPDPLYNTPKNVSQRKYLWRRGRGGVDDGNGSEMKWWWWDIGCGCMEVRVVVAVIRVAAGKSRRKDEEAPERVYRTAATPRPKYDPVSLTRFRSKMWLPWKCKTRALWKVLGQGKIDLLPIHGWVTWINLSTRMGRDQQLPSGYPERLQRSIASRIWVIGYGLRLAVMKCGESTKLRQVFADVVSAVIAKAMSEGLKYGVEHGKANLDLEAIEAYDRRPRLNTLRPSML
nr:hypothetical protein [Tanacetum cinerariifolium]